MYMKNLFLLKDFLAVSDIHSRKMLSQVINRATNLQLLWINCHSREYSYGCVTCKTSFINIWKLQNIPTTRTTLKSCKYTTNLLSLCYATHRCSTVTLLLSVMYWHICSTFARPISCICNSFVPFAPVYLKRSCGSQQNKALIVRLWGSAF